jgi:3-mercaptopyruvate sulfurtransferase SseA
MLKHIAPLAVLLAANVAMGGAAQNPPPAKPTAQVQPAAPADPLAAAPRISVAEAKKALDSGKAVLVDVRAAQAFQMEHAKGAVNIPLDEVASRAGELPRDKQIITYCT